MNQRLIVIVASLAFLGGIVVATGLGAAMLFLLPASERVTLPESELAGPTEAGSTISVTLLANGSVAVRERKHSKTDLGLLLREELHQLEGVSRDD